MRVVVLFNPVSGGGHGRVLAAEVSGALVARGHAVELIASEPGDASVWFGGKGAGVDVVAVVGGDGTVRSVAGVVADAKCAILHVPSGNENLFARGFGMSGVVTDVVAAVEHGTHGEVDMASVNGETMLLMASVGLDAEIVREVASRRGDSVSNWTYVRAALACVRRCSPPRCTVVVDGQDFVRDVSGWVVVANSPEYGGRVNPAPMAAMDDRKLDVVFFPASTSLGVLRWMNRCRRGRQMECAGFVHTVASRDIGISLAEPAIFQIDGDAGGAAETASSVNVSLLGKRLKVQLPPV